MLSIVAFMAISFAHAQQIALSWSAEYSVNAASHSLVCGSNRQILKLSLIPEFGKEAWSKPIITGYDQQLKEASRELMQPPASGFKPGELLNMKGNLYFFTSSYEKNSKSTTFYCQPLDILSLKHKGNNISLTTLIADKESEKPSLKQILSDDSTKVLFTDSRSQNKSGMENCYLGVYNEKMEKLWSKTIDMQGKNKVVLLDQKVTNDGKVFLLIKHFEDGTDKEQTTKNGKKVPAYVIKLLLYDKDGAVPKEFVLNTGDEFIHSLAFAKQHNNELTLFGLQQQKTEGNISGYFIVQINTSNSKSTITRGGFSDHLLGQLEKDEQGNDGKKGGGLARYFKFVKMETRGNGDRDFLLEFTLNTIGANGFSMGNSASARTITTYTDIYHGNIIDIQIKADGTSFITRIPKLQNVADLAHVSSFKTLVYQDKLLVFYNDNEDNLKQDIGNKPKKTGLGIAGRKLLGAVDASLVMAVIDAQGNLSRKVIIDKKQSKFVSAVNSSLKLDGDKIAFYAFNGRREMMGLLEVK